MNSNVYEIEFDDGSVQEYSANVIAENMLSQEDDEGYSTTMMEAIVDFKKDDAVAVPRSDKYVYTRIAQKWNRVTSSVLNASCSWGRWHGVVDPFEGFEDF